MTRSYVPWAGITRYCTCDHPTGNHLSEKQTTGVITPTSCRRCNCQQYQRSKKTRDNRYPATVRHIDGRYE